MMLASQLPGIYVKQLGTRIVARALSLSSNHSRAQQNSSKDTKAHSITQRKTLTEDEIQKIINLDNIHLETKVQKRSAEREPLVKNFFIGKVDAVLLAYPQVIENEDYQKLIEKFQPVHSYFAEKSKKVLDANCRDVGQDIISDFRRMQIFGRTVTGGFGGLGYFNTEANLASECESVDVKFAEIIAGHRLTTEVITAHGTQSQKDKYLLELSKGNLIGCVCVHDPQSGGAECINATRCTPGSSEWILNGSRSFVVKSRHANLLIVSAVTEEESEYNGEPSTKESITFVLDATTPGVSFKESGETIGCSEVPYVIVDFSNVRLNEESVLSERHDNRTAAELLVCNSRMQVAILNAIQTKKILNHLVTHMLTATHNGTKLLDVETYRHGLATLAAELYALESMTYLTAGISDSYENPKIDVETAIVKSFSLDLIAHALELILSFPAASFGIKGHPCEEYIRNSSQLSLAWRAEAENLKIHIGLAGLQHCDNIKGNRVKSHTDSALSWLYRGPTIDDITSNDFNLIEYVHPSFENTMTLVEESILRLHIGTEILLHRYGSNVDERAVEVRKLGDAAIRNYAMFASASRASRSYCIGLRHSKYETVIAAGLAEANAMHIHSLMNDIKKHEKMYENYQQIGNAIVNPQFKWPSSALQSNKN